MTSLLFIRLVVVKCDLETIIEFLIYNSKVKKPELEDMALEVKNLLKKLKDVL